MLLNNNPQKSIVMKRIILSLISLIAVVGVYAHDFEEANADGKTIYYNDVSSKYSFNAAEVTYKGSWYGADSLNYEDTIVIPNTVSHGGKTYTVVGIGEQAFSMCGTLKSVTIADSIKYIKDKAFQRCYRLAQVNYNAVRCADISTQEFAPFYAGTLFWNHEVKKDTSDNIPDTVFQEFALREVNIGPKVERIPSFMFYGMGAYVYMVDYTKYKQSYRRSDVVIKDSVYGVEKINFASTTTLKEIGDQAFRYNMAMTEATIPANVTKLGIALFADCDTLQKVVIKAPVQALPSYTFMNSKQLHDVTLPNSITTLSYQSFKGCTGLKTINLPVSLLTIGPSVFPDCDNLPAITLPNSLVSIDGYSFSGCTVLDNVVIPTSVQTIGNYAFEDCTNLTTVTMLGTPKLFGNFVFSGCRNLSNGTFYAPAAMPAIREYTFDGVANSMRVVVDEASRATYAADPYWGRFFEPTELEESFAEGNQAAATKEGVKTLKDGKLLIQKGDKFYNVLGQEIPVK